MILPALLLVAASGYLKNLHQHSASDLNTSRARLTLDARLPIARAHVDSDMEQLLSEGAAPVWRHRLYRGWAGLETEKAALRFGRQRVAWGTGKLWNPTDVLNPYQPLSVERDERPGVDALYARQGFGLFTQAEAAYALENRWADSALLGRVKSHWDEYDVSLMGGKAPTAARSWMTGGDFAGNLWEGTLHGEWAYTDLKARAPFWKADVGYTYTFATETRFAPLRDAALAAEYLRDGGTFSSPRDYLGLTYSKDVHPLLKLELLLISNLNDKSQFFSPSLQFNALENLYVTVGLQRFGGPRRTEFGRPANVAFMQGQYFF